MARVERTDWSVRGGIVAFHNSTCNAFVGIIKFYPVQIRLIRIALLFFLLLFRIKWASASTMTTEWIKRMDNSSIKPLSAKTLFGVFFISASALMLEISLSRILSITLWYHFAFLIISCALLGYGVAGVWLHLFAKPDNPFPGSWLYSALLLPLVLLGNRIPFDPPLAALNPFHAVNLLGIFILLCIPFFLAGMTIIMVIRQHPQQTFQIYCFDLIGAAAGCFGFFVLAPLLREQEWLLVLTAIAGVSVLMFSYGNRQRLLALTSVLIYSVFYLIGPPVSFKIIEYKPFSLAEQSPGFRHLDTRWDSVSRIDWFESPIARSAPGLSLNYRDSVPEQNGITLDGDQLSTYFKVGAASEAFLKNLPSELLLRMTEKAENSLVLQTVGGQAVHSELKSKVNHITVQSNSPILANWLDNHFDSNRTTFHSDSPRTLLAKPGVKFDRIRVSLDSASPSGGSGMNSLQGNSLLTVEGIKALLSRLDQQGWLGFHFYLLPPTRAEFRLIVSLVTVLDELGLEASQHLGIFRTISTMMVVTSAQPWQEKDKYRFREYCDELGYAIVYYPGMNIEEANRFNRYALPVFAEQVREILENRESVVSDSAFDLRPVSDDRPFFYHFLRLNKIPEYYSAFDGKWEALIEGGGLLPIIWCLVFLLAIVLIITPLGLAGKELLRRPALPFYFLSLGFGFMLVEISLLEKLILFLGQPTYSFALVLGGLLVSSGLGSWLVRGRSIRQQSLIHICLIILLFLYGFCVDSVSRHFMGADLGTRMIISLLLVVFPGLMMGIPFPRGLVKISRIDESGHLVFSAWSFNSFASILGSVTAMILAVIIGFNSLLYIASACYLASWVLYRHFGAKRA